MDETSQEPKQPSASEQKDLRHAIGRKVSSIKKYIRRKYDEEAKTYMKVFRHEFSSLLPERLLKMDDVDVNVVFPIVKTLIPSLYFQDPKVYIKAEQEKIIIEHNDPETGQPLLDQNGQPMIDQYDAVESAYKFQGHLNSNIREAKLKREMKMALADGLIGYYGAIKTGINHDQGVASMGEGAPPSTRDDVKQGLCYGIRLKPWDVLVDMTDFYNPEWMAIRYEVHPEQLKKDTRLQNTEKLKGNCEMKEDMRREMWSNLDLQDYKKTEYFEFYQKPCAQYPEGIYAIFSDEVADDFLYFGPWPYHGDVTSHEFPVKLLYFNPDPEGGLPIPDVRYYIAQQKAKSNLRRVLYDTVQRTTPFVGLDSTKTDERTQQQLSSGRNPRVVFTKGNPASIISSQSFNNVNSDFHIFDGLTDDDISRATGLLKGVHTGGQSNVQFSSQVKAADENEAIRGKERADVVRDFLAEIIANWGDFTQEFGPDEMYVPTDNSKFPVKLGIDELQGKFKYEIKPFSMNYEDPIVLREQWLKLWNLMIAPASAQGLAAQGASLDYVKLFGRILLTYDDPDAQNFILDEASKAENQVRDAVSENMMIEQGQMDQAQVLPTDNDQVHLIIHGMMPDVPGKLEHMQAHQQKMLQAAGVPGKPGGGNKEGLPTKGEAINQEQMTKSPEPSSVNQATAITREASQ